MPEKSRLASRATYCVVGGDHADDKVAGQLARARGGVPFTERRLAAVRRPPAAVAVPKYVDGYKSRGGVLNISNKLNFYFTKTVALKKGQYLNTFLL